MSAVSERVVLQEAIVAAWAKEGHDMSKMFTVAGIAADVALATRDARIARLESALRPFAAMDFAGSIYAEYVARGDAPESVAVLCAYADGKPSGVNVTMADFATARATLEVKP